jgi:hypothetical protein
MRRIIVGAFVSMDGVMQAPGGPTEDPQRGGEIKIVDGALDSPSKRKSARQERMKREG